MSTHPSSASRHRAKALTLLIGLLLLGAFGIRMLWQRQSKALPPASPPLAMDDSKAELPLTPPPMPADNAASLRAAHQRLEPLATAALHMAASISKTNEATVNTALIQSATLALDIGDLWQAEALTQTLLHNDPRNRAARLALGENLRRQARFAEAERLYQQLLNEDSHDSDAYLGLADTTFAANNRPQAFAWLARAVTDGAQTALSLTTLAHRYQDWKDYPKAEVTAARALSVAPEDNSARLQLASIQVESGELDAGYRTLETILKQDPNNGLAHRLLAVVLMNATFAHQDVNRARSLLERAVELNAKDPDIYRSAAVIYRQQRLYRLAAQAYDALLQLDPTSLDGRYGLGQVYALLGKTELSREQLALYKQLDERQRIVTQFSEEVVHHPTVAEAHAALARALERTGDYARALPQYQTAAGLNPHNAAIQKDLHRFYERMGWQMQGRKFQ